MIDEALYAPRLHSSGDGAGVGHFLAADVRANVIDRANAVAGAAKRLLVLEAGGDALRGADGLQRGEMLTAAHHSPDAGALFCQRLDHGLTGLAGGAGHQDHCC